MRIRFLLLTIAMLIAGCGEKDPGLEVSGTVEVKEVDVSSITGGKITQLYRREGEEVRKGQILAKLEDTVQRARLQSARTIHKNAESQYKRSLSLFKSNSMPKIELEKAETAFAQARAGLEEADYMLSETEIKAPLKGRILKRHAETGEIIAPGTPVFTVANLKTVEVILYIPLPSLGKIKLGQKVEIKTDSYKNKIYTGKITTISNEAEFTPKNVQTKEERVKLVFRVEVMAENPLQELKPGMPVDVWIALEED
jgi:HlyD family secretion protein